MSLYVAFLDCFLHSPAYTFRKEGHTKIIEYDLSEKQKKQRLKKRPDVLIQEKATGFTLLQSEKPDRDADPDIDMSEPESSEKSTDGEEEEDDSIPQVLQLPKAANGRTKTARGRNERVIAPEECRAHLRRLFHKEGIMCSLLYGRHGPFASLSHEGLSFASASMFFMEVIPVPPTRFRPPAKMNETLFEHPQNELLAKVLNTSYRLRDLNIELRSASQKTPEFDEATRKKLLGVLLDNLVQLQVDVNSFMDSSKNPAIVRQGKLPPAGVKQGLEKKEGLFRKHMMVCILNLSYLTNLVERAFLTMIG
jgi:DNA-directed RNA polymerase beta' subunit